MASAFADLSLISYAAALASLIFLYILGIIFYRVYLHPLSTYPGPRLWAATRLPYAYHVVRGTLVYRIEKLHQEYGPTVRIAPTELSYTDEHAWNDIYGKSPHGMPQLKKPRRDDVPDDAPHDFVLEGNDTEHARMRRVLSPGFSEKALRDQEPIMNTYFDKLMQRLHENSGKPVDVAKWFSFTAFDIVGDLTFGESFDCLETSTQHFWVDMFFKHIRTQLYSALCYNFPPLEKVLGALVPKKGRELIKKHRELTAAKVMKRLGSTVPRPDFLSAAQKSLDTPGGMSTGELKASVPTIVIAGAETTGTALAATTYFLLKNPHTLRKLTAEVRGAFQHESDITMVSVNGLNYQLAVLNETLRIMPPAAGTFPRSTPPSGSTICGRFVPGNVIVGVNPWAAFHIDSNFREPHSFIPERWAERKDLEFKDDNRKVMQPFSSGPRNCIGRNLAYAEMRVILARLTWNFDMELCKESEDWTTGLKVWVVYDKPPLWVKLIPVERK